MRRSIYVIVLISLFNYSYLQDLSGQKHSLSKDSLLIYYENIDGAYGLDQMLINGVYFENVYKYDLGNPYFLQDEFTKGYIVLHGKKYTNQLIKYDLFEQNILLKINKNNTQFVIIVPSEFITEFSIGGYIFHKYSLFGEEKMFYQDIFTGRISCYYSWEKERVRSYHNGNHAAYRYFNGSRKFYLVIDKKVMNYKNNRSFLKIFPKEIKKEISAYMRLNNINMQQSNDNKIQALMAYCNKIYITNE